MTSKEFVKSVYPKARVESHTGYDLKLHQNIRYFIVRNGNETMYIATGNSESNAWVNAKKIIQKVYNLTIKNMSKSNFSYNIDNYISGPFRDYDKALNDFNDYQENNNWDGDLMLGSTQDGVYYIFETKDVVDASSDSEEISGLTTEGQIFIEEVTEMVH